MRSGSVAGERGLDLASIFPQGRFDERQPEPLVHGFLGVGGQQRAPRGSEEPVLVQLQLLANRHLPDADVVRLRPGEVDHRRAPGRELDDAKVHLEPARRHDRGLRGSVGEHARDGAVPDERIHHPLGTVARHEQIDVADRLRHAPQRPGVGGASDTGDGAQPVEQVLRDLEGLVRPAPGPRSPAAAAPPRRRCARSCVRTPSWPARRPSSAAATSPSTESMPSSR